MSLSATPRGERIHIAIVGRSNVGKSSIINALTGQDVAVVSAVRGTTTDPVFKPMELLPLGPIVLIDTAGLDDEGDLGELRMQKTRELLNRTELALLVVDACVGADDFDIRLLADLKDKHIPVVGILNKVDAAMDLEDVHIQVESQLGIRFIPFSATMRQGVADLKQAMIAAVPQQEDKLRIVSDLIAPGDCVVLVVPIDSAAPKGRLILPQQQTIRDILERDAIAIVAKEHELPATLNRLQGTPQLVITDSQAFLKVAADTPPEIPLTSFSILFARYKGNLHELVRGARTIEQLNDGDSILIAEACTHHQQSDDIGTVKIPQWLRQKTGKQLHFDWVSGHRYPPELSCYSLIIHCGACMLNRPAMLHRIDRAREAGIPIVNYGVLIAYIHGVFPRAISMFPDALQAWHER